MSIIRARTQLEKSRDKLTAKKLQIMEKAKVDIALVDIEFNQVTRALEALPKESDDEAVQNHTDGSKIIDTKCA